MEVRELKAKDLKSLVKMLGKLSPQSREEIVKLLAGKGQSEADLMAVGIGIFQILAEMTDDIYSWLADMASITVQELDEMPASAPIDIVKEIISRGDFQGFLSSAASRGKTE